MYVYNLIYYALQEVGIYNHLELQIILPAES